MKEVKKAPKRITMKDVAQYAGVTTAIVSRVINKDETLNIKDETRSAVVKAVEDLNYVPNLRARSLRTQKNYVIGVVITDIMNPFYTQVVKGIQNAANNTGYTVMLFDTGDDPDKEKWVIDIAKSQGVDGIILGSTYIDDETVHVLKNIGMKYVMLNRVASSSDAPYVRVDDTKGMSLAVNHLAELGHKKIAYLSGPLYADTALKRLEGYRKALFSNKLEYNSKYVLETKFDVATGKACCKELLKSFPEEERPTAICAGNDLVAIGAMEAISEAGLSIPEDFSVTGYNNIWIADKITPALTTVNTPQEEMGSKAFEVLLQLINDEDFDVKNLDLEPELILRNSTGKAKI